jgi:hypothetical protein
VEAIFSSENSVDSQRTTRRYIPDVTTSLLSGVDDDDDGAAFATHVGRHL